MQVLTTQQARFASISVLQRIDLSMCFKKRALSLSRNNSLTNKKFRVRPRLVYVPAASAKEIPGGIRSARRLAADRFCKGAQNREDTYVTSGRIVIQGQCFCARFSRDSHDACIHAGWLLAETMIAASIACNRSRSPPS